MAKETKYRCIKCDIAFVHEGCSSKAKCPLCNQRIYLLINK